MQTIVEGIEATEDVPGRMHVVDEEQPFGVIVDSASTPSALSRLLDDVRDLQFMPRMIGGRIGTKVRRIILVVGVKGDRPPAMRPLLGEVAHWKARRLVVRVCGRPSRSGRCPGPSVRVPSSGGRAAVAGCKLECPLIGGDLH